MNIIRKDGLMVRAVRLAFFVLPIVYVAGALSAAVHEVLGHGLSAVLLGGEFSGFTVKWDGMGWAFATLPADGASASHQILFWASGIIATTVCGAILWGLVFFFRRRPDIQLAMLVTAFVLLISGIDYVVWNAYHPIPSTGDIGKIIMFCHILEFPDPTVLRWVLLITGVLLFAGTTFYFCTSIFVRAEALILSGGRLTGKSRFLVLFLFLVLPGAYAFLSFDLNQLAPGIGRVPNVAGALGIIAVAGLLFWYRPKLKNGNSVPLITWRHLVVSGTCLLVTITALALWLNEGLIWSPMQIGDAGQAMVIRIDGPTPSPDGRYVAFSIVKENAEVGVLDLQSGSVRTIPVPGKFVDASFGMSWSPDGTFLVATVVEDNGPFALWSLSWTDAQWYKLVELPDDSCGHSLVSPQGDSVLFRANWTRDLKRFDLGSGQLKSLTETGDIYRFGYAWSPDGSKIYFSRGYMKEDGGFWVMQADGTNKTLISDDVQPNSLAISATGQYVAYTTYGEPVDNPRYSLHVAKLPGFDRTKIGSASIYYFPQWHAEKDELLFHEGGSVKVWSAPDGKAEGPSIRWIATGFFPVWAETGGTIVLRRNKTELWRYDVRTEELRRVYSLDE
jgi:hypothetical protein